MLLYTTLGIYRVDKEWLEGIRIENVFTNGTLIPASPWKDRYTTMHLVNPAQVVSLRWM